MLKSDMAENNLIIYTDNDGRTRIDVRLEEETLWLSQQQMAELYQTPRTNVIEHIKHIYEEGELQEEGTSVLQPGYDHRPRLPRPLHHSNKNTASISSEQSVMSSGIICLQLN